MLVERRQHVSTGSIDPLRRSANLSGTVGVRPRVALGPVMPGWGSWEWLGEDLGQTLLAWADVTTFNDMPPRDVDLVVVIKHPLPHVYWKQKPTDTPVVYCPVDFYGSAAEITADGWWLTQCARIIVHSRRLTPYFQGWAPVITLDHQLRFINYEQARYTPERPLLWVGVRSNLPPLAAWLQAHTLPRDLIVLTNPERPEDLVHTEHFGLPQTPRIRLETWTPERHRELLGNVSGAFDIKGDDFRARHKPATKATDFIASGVPVALQRESSSYEQLAVWGFDVATLDDTERWFSRKYWEETQTFACELRETLSRDQIGKQLRDILGEVLQASRSSALGETMPVALLRQQAEARVRVRDWEGAKEFYRQLADLESDLKQKVLWQNNLALLKTMVDSNGDRPTLDVVVVPATENQLPTDANCEESPSVTPSPRQRIAILSLLFNWPSTGGGTVHTAETGHFLAQAGYDVQHIFARFEGWGVGAVTDDYQVPHRPLVFAESEWHAAEIQRRFRAAVDDFHPDAILITDSWNFKPLLAEAVRGYPYFLRLAAQETLCPLNNVRMLCDSAGEIATCPLQQLSHPHNCRDCVAHNEHYSGSLHQAERNLSGYGTKHYDLILRQAYAVAAGVLVVNPQIAEMVRPFSERVHVIPSGFDPARFPAPAATDRSSPGKRRLVFAGLVQEYMKGFHVLDAACQQLWERRQDFELIVTGDAPDNPAPWAHYIGWQSQAALPRVLREGDVVVVPTVAEEALGRTAVEAMGAGKPVIASRIGGLPFTVLDGVTGLLFEPGNVNDLVRKIERLLDDREHREQLGAAGRTRFAREFHWPTIIEQNYRPLFDALRTNDETSPAQNCLPMSTEPGWQPTLSWKGADAEARLRDEVGKFFGHSPSSLQRMWETYHEFHQAENYTARFGDWKTLAEEEAFVLAMMLSCWQPECIIEIGTQSGKSTRKILDLIALLGLSSHVCSYDIVSEAVYVRPDEADLCVEDLTGRFREEVLDKHPGGLIFLDAHPQALLQEVIRETLQHEGNWLLAIHDCTAALCNPQMAIAPDDPDVTSQTGIWERHVLADAFEIDDPLCRELDDQANATHRLKIFGTRHGLAVIVPRWLLPEQNDSEQSNDMLMDALVLETGMRRL